MPINAPQNFVSQQTVVQANWLNLVDVLCNQVFQNPSSIQQAQQALFTGAPVVVGFGGTGATTAPGALANLGGQPLTAQTTAEFNANVTPVNLQYPQGDVRRYGAVPAPADSTAAFTAAAAVQAQDNSTVTVIGIYNITPAATIQMTGDWVGNGINVSQIRVTLNSLGAGLPVFQLQGNRTARDFTLSALGVGVTQHGIFLSNIVPGSFTGGQRLSRLNIQNFSNGIMLGNVFNVVGDQLNVQNNVIGLYCVPSQYVAAISFKDCFFNANGQNVFFNAPINCMGVSFRGGAIQDSGTTGTGSAQAYFNNVFDLELSCIYTEGNPSNPWLYLSSVGPCRVSGINNGAGGIFCAGGINAQIYLENYLGGTINIGSGNQLSLVNTVLAPSGNSFPPQTTIINGRLNSIVAPSIVAGFGSPSGASVIANFPGASATLGQCSATIAQMLNMMLSRAWAQP